MKPFFPHITVDAGVQFGKPVIEGTRVPVEVVMAEYALTRDQVLAT